jgi:redox-sensitive bicupin YhaK (pirin superfamily)
MKIYRQKDLGHFKNEWLNSYHHFSFGHYHDPARMSFGALRVINDDVIEAGTGFDPHPHKDMEIITYVREGTIFHRDNLGNEGATKAGNVQVMTAGSGIAHAEYADPETQTKIFQIWITPREKNLTPSWAQIEFPREALNDNLKLLASGRKEHQSLIDKDAVLEIHQEASLYAGIVEKDQQIKHSIERSAYLLVSKGELVIKGETIKEGDGVEIAEAGTLEMIAVSHSEILLIDL